MKKLVVSMLCAFAALSAFAQSYDVKAVLKDANTDEPVSYATVSITRVGQEKPTKYTLSDYDGIVTIENVRKGDYLLKAELLGFVTLSKKITVENSVVDLGTLVMLPDEEQLEAARISAATNPVIIKKDTIEYNASSYLTAENAVLEDLLKKLPGIEVSENGSISSNGKTISKITIAGKTFFLDDPTVASKNIPAKLINKLKVIQKKSEQAEFTGIDDGQEEYVIDLSVQPGSMNGLIGRMTAGAGNDIPSSVNSNNDFRYTGNAFIGRFSDNTQISLILNANNANRAGATNRAGNMMGAMMGGGGPMGGGQGGFGGANGITTTYSAGLNIAGNLFDDRMELGGNYMFNWNNNDVLEKTVQTTFRPEKSNLVYDSDGMSNTLSRGHRIGFRLEHQFSENTSILLQPEINFGSGTMFSKSDNTTYDGTLAAGNELNYSDQKSSGVNKSVTATTMFLFRQRLGLPGRTFTLMGDLNYSNNNMDGNNYSFTKVYNQGDKAPSEINQDYTQLGRNMGVMANATYTEPMGNYFYLQAQYSFNWNKSESSKETIDLFTGKKDYTYSNEVINQSTTQQIGANLLYQSDSFHAQVGFFGIPSHTYNSTTVYNTTTKEYKPVEYVDDRWNFSPQAMLFADFSENSTIRFFYRGNSSQPSTSQLNPVPDNTNPINVTFGNTELSPYFSHNLNGNYSISNRRTYFSFNTNFNAGMVTNPITNAIWYGNSGQQYSMPFNGANRGNAGLNAMLSTPIGFTKFTISNSLGGNWNTSSTYVGKDIDMSKYPDPLTDYYKFMEEFGKDHKDVTNDPNFAKSVTNSFIFNDRFRLVYRADQLSLEGSFNTRINKTWVKVGTSDNNTTTLNNQLGLTANFVSSDATFSAEANYRFNWYNGHTTAQPDEHVLNLTLSKTVLKGAMTISLTGTDLLGQTRNLTVDDTSNYHSETLNNTLGRYVILSLSYNFGSMGRRGNRSSMGGGMGGGRMGGGMMGRPGGMM